MCVSRKSLREDWRCSEMRNKRDAGIISGRVLINLGFSSESDGVLWVLSQEVA